MQLKYTLAVVSLMGAVAFAGPNDTTVTNPSNTSGATSNGTSAPAASLVAGTVQNVDKTTNSVQVKDSTGNLQIVKVDTNTQISRSGNPVQLSDLKIGDVVSIQMSNTNNGTM